MENVEKLLKQILESQTTMQKDISGMKNDITSMKSDIVSMKTDIENLKDGQTNMQKDIVYLKQGQTNMQKDIEYLKQGQTDIKTEIKMVQSQADGIKNQITDFKADFKNLEALNAVRHTEIQIKLDTLSDDIEFLKHEEYQTKQDVFKMRKKLEIIK